MADGTPPTTPSASGTEKKHRLDFSGPPPKWQRKGGTRAWFSLSNLPGGGESGNGALFVKACVKAGEDEDLDTLTAAVQAASLPCNITTGVSKSNLTVCPSQSEASTRDAQGARR